MSKNPSYIVRQSCGYCYRQVVPPDLKHLVRKTEIRYNLYTGSLREAKSRSNIISGQVHQLFLKLRSEGYSMPGSRLSEAEINELIRAYVKQAIEDAELYRATSKKRLNSDTVDEELDLIGSLKAEFRESLAYRDFGVVKPSVDSLLKENNIELDEESDEYRQLSHQMLKAQIFLSDIDKKQALGDYTYQDQDFLTPSPSQPGVSPQVQPSETLGKIVEAYWAENSGRWKQRSVVEFKVFKKSLLDFLKPDTQIHAITYETGRNYKESLKKKKNQGGHPLSDSRINNYLSFASTLFRWAKRQHLTELNPFEGLQIAGTKKRVDQLRDVFSKADLEKMFCTSNEYGKDAHIHAHNFWVSPAI